MLLIRGDFLNWSESGSSLVGLSIWLKLLLFCDDESLGDLLVGLDGLLVDLVLLGLSLLSSEFLLKIAELIHELLVGLAKFIELPLHNNFQIFKFLFEIQNLEAIL